MHFPKPAFLKLIAVVLACSALWASPVQALRVGTKFWFPLSLEGNYGDLLYFVQPQLRLIERTNLFNQFINYVGFGREIAPEWQFWLGQTISTVAQDAVSASSEEYRAWEQVVWKRDMPRYSLLSQTRMEERKSLEFPQWAFRIRELIRVTVPVASNLALEFQNELFYSFNLVPWIATKHWDQDRAYIGVVQKLSNRRSLGAGIMQQVLFLQTGTRNDTVLLASFRFYLFENNT